MQELLLAVARGLVEDKEAVKVTVDEPREDGTIVYHLSVASMYKSCMHTQSDGKTKKSRSDRDKRRHGRRLPDRKSKFGYYAEADQ